MRSLRSRPLIALSPSTAGNTVLAGEQSESNYLLGSISILLPAAYCTLLKPLAMVAKHSLARPFPAPLVLCFVSRFVLPMPVLIEVVFRAEQRHLIIAAVSIVWQYMLA